MTNIGYFPDQHEGMGNSGFQNAVYYPEQQCQPTEGGGGFFGGILDSIMSVFGPQDACAPAPAEMPAPSTEPKSYWI